MLLHYPISQLPMNDLSQITNSVMQVVKVSRNVLNSYKSSMIAFPGHISLKCYIIIHVLLFAN